MSTTAISRQPIPNRTIKTRRLDLDYPTDAMPRHYISNDIAMSHIVSMLSAVFPEGEDFFVQSVRNYRDRVTDPELKTQVAGFIGQEAMHSREHRAFNESLARLGYPTRFVDRLTGFGLSVGAKVLPKSVQLAITAALEHYTATLAEVLLTDEQARELFDVDEVGSLFLWHALEESEHKSVAFDVYQEVSGNLLIRRAIMIATTVGLLGGIALASVLSLVLDPGMRSRKGVRSVRNLRNSPWLTRDVRRRISAYNRRDFHPDHFDNAALTAEWREKLFGPKGTIAAQLKTGQLKTGPSVNITEATA